MSGAERARSDRMDPAEIACGRLGAVRRDGFVISDKSRGVDTAGASQDTQQIKTSSLGHAPRSHELTSYPIDCTEVAFEHRHR